MEEITENSKGIHTCEEAFGLCPGTRTTSTPYTMQVTLVNGLKGMMDTRTIHVLCPWWKGLFAAMVRETVAEGGDEHFSPNWHGFLRGRRRERELCSHKDAWDGICLGKFHLNSLTDMSNAFSCTKRDKANEQMFKGDLWMAQRLRNSVVFLQGHDGEFTFMVKHGFLMGTSEVPRIFS